MKKARRRYIHTICYFAFICITAAFPAMAANRDISLHNQQLSVTVLSRDGAWEIRTAGSDHMILRAITGAQIDHRWIKSSQYPKHHASQSRFEDRLGRGRQVTVTFTGLRAKPDLLYVLHLYDQLPFGDIQASVRNHTAKTVTVQKLRSVDAVGPNTPDLQGPASEDRVLSDSDTNMNALRILDFGNAPGGAHDARWNQLIYNRQSRQSILFGALTARRFFTMMHLKVRDSGTGPKIDSYVIESTDATEALLTSAGSYLSRTLPEDQIQLSLRLAPGKSLASERLLFSSGPDYFAQLEAYGEAVRLLMEARTNSKNTFGWAPWNIYDTDVTEGYILTNARWLSKHLLSEGIDSVHEYGVFYAEGDVIEDAAKFPHGMAVLAREIAGLGLTTAGVLNPFSIEETSWVYQRHKEWLVRNGRGRPITLVRSREGGPKTNQFVLDATHPGARKYLRRIYQTLVRKWGWQIIDLDGMDWSCIEGRRYRPNTTALEAQRIALKIIRESVGDRVILSSLSGPLMSTIGFVDESTISPDLLHTFLSSKEAAPGVAAHYYTHRRFFVNSANVFNLQREVPAVESSEQTATSASFSLQDARISIVLAAITGGAYEIGDDLPTLGSEPERLALVTNPTILQIARLGRSATPLDLMTYKSEDEQPSIFFLHEDERESVLAVFNWTEKVQSHSFTLPDLGLAPGHPYHLFDALNQDAPLIFDGNTILIEGQPAHSVKLIKIIDESKHPDPPTLAIQAPEKARVREDVTFSAYPADQRLHLPDIHWDFGDGTSANGALQRHTYTRADTYAVTLTVKGPANLSVQKTFQIKVEGLMEIGPPRRFRPTDHQFNMQPN